MFVVIREDGLNVPAALCDQCGERIEEAGQGNYCWNPKADGAPEMLFTHKWCYGPWRSSNHTVDWAANGLSVLPVYLEESLNVDRERAVSKAAMLASL